MPGGCVASGSSSSLQFNNKSLCDSDLSVQCHLEHVLILGFLIQGCALLFNLPGLDWAGVMQPGRGVLPRWAALCFFSQPPVFRKDPTGWTY